MNYFKILILCIAICSSAGISAQKIFASAKYTQMCSYYGETVTGDIHAFKPDASAQAVIKNIMGVIGLKANFELRVANVPNAAAVILKGKRYILYNPKFMENINSVTGSNWAAVSILAHEIGHHLNGHTLDNVGSRPQTELDADEFSGFVLQKLGASLADAQAVMGKISSIKGSHSHPPRGHRLIAIKAGWNRALGISANDNTIAEIKKETHKTSATKPQPKRRVVHVPTKEQKIQQSASHNANIASDAYFISDPRGKYYLTKKGNLVQVDKNKVYMIATLFRSDRPGYKLMLSDNRETCLYIGEGGALINKTGDKVGLLKARN